jgi:hypothetical protein
MISLLTAVNTEDFEAFLALLPCTTRLSTHLAHVLHEGATSKENGSQYLKSATLFPGVVFSADLLLGEKKKRSQGKKPDVVRSGV